MVARGEIGLLIAEIGYTYTPYMSNLGFYTSIWAIISNTVVGPMAVGILIKFRGESLGKGRWGVREGGKSDTDDQLTILESGLPAYLS